MDELESSTRTVCKEVAGDEEQCCDAVLPRSSGWIECVVHIRPRSVFLSQVVVDDIVAFLAL